MSAGSGTTPCIDVAMLGHLESPQRYAQMMRALGKRDSTMSNLERTLPHMAPAPICDIKIYSPTGLQLRARYIDLFLHVDQNFEPLRALTKLDLALAEAKRSGGQLCALGGFSSIIGEAARLQNTPLPCTTGNSLTAAVIHAQVHAARAIAPAGPIAVIGAAGDVGSGLCRALDEDGEQLLLVGRSPRPLQQLARRLARASVTPLADACERAAILVLVASSGSAGLDLPGTRQDALVLDAGHPANLSATFGGHAARAGRVHYAIPLEAELQSLLEAPDQAHACLAEAAVLAFERRFEPYSQGRGNITPEAMRHILALASRHGVRPAALQFADKGAALLDT